MKVLLVNPPNCGRSIPEEEFGITSIKQIFRGEPFSLEALAGGLSTHEVHIIDLKCEEENLLWQELADFKPDIVGFTAVTCEANKVLAFARQIKSQMDCRIVVGGNHASCDPQFFNQPQIDFIVIGIGKKSFGELVGKLEKNEADIDIPGVARTREGEHLQFTPRNYSRADLMEDCPPRYDLVEKYRSHYVLEKLNMRMGFVITAQGCTHHCAFCAIPPTTGGKYLLHGNDSVLRDISLLGDIPFIRMVDANTFGNPQASQELCARIKAAGIRKKYIADVRADTIVNHYDLLKEWQEAGLAGVVVGFEEVEDSRLSAYHKQYKSDVVPRSLEMLHKLGLMIVGDFIVSPEYTEDDFTRLEKFILQHKIHVPMLSILTPLPGTPLYASVKEQLLIHDLDYYTFTNAVTPTRLPQRQFYETYAAIMKRFHSH